MQSPACWPIAILAVAVATLSVPSAGSSPTAFDTYNTRPIGSPGIRRLELQLKNGTSVTRQFNVVHLWQQDGAETRSLVFLERPTELRGTSYLWIEGGTVPGGLQVFLRLPAGQRRVLSITPSRFDEGLLGSDFAYSDLLWRIPTAGRRVRETGATRLDDVEVRVWESEPAESAPALGTRWQRIRYYVSADGSTLRGVDYYDTRERDDAARAPVKRLRGFDWRRYDTAIVPARMVMTVGATRSSELTLTSVQLGIPAVERTFFEPASLGTLADGFERGRPHAVFQSTGR